MAHIIKCLYCGETFDRDKFKDYVQIKRRYAHTSCAQQYEQTKSQEEKDKEALDEYIKRLFNLTSVNAKVRTQIKHYVEDNHYTYAGILKSLKYFYEVKGNDIAKAQGGIGIVPYVYDNAHNYYLLIWQSNQRNEVKIVQQPQYVERTVTIPVPRRVVKTRRKFGWLEDDE